MSPGNPAPCTKRKERATRLPQIKVKGRGRGRPRYTTLAALHYGVSRFALKA